MTIASLQVGEVARFLEERYGNVTDVIALDGGAWSRAFAFSTGDAELVVRFGHHAEDYEKDRTASQWWGGTLPIPEVLRIGDAYDGVYAVSRHAVGTPIDRLPEAQLREAISGLVETIRNLRGLELPGTGFGPWDPTTGDGAFPSWGAYLLDVPERDEERLVGWRAALAAHPDAADVFTAGCEAMGSPAEACPDVRGVVHNDLLAGNVLVDGDEVTAVLDWGNSLAGDPLYDIVWLLYWAPWHAGLDGSLVRELADDLLTDGELETRRRTYELHIALDHQQYCAWVGDEHGLAWNTQQVRRLLAD